MDLIIKTGSTPETLRPHGDFEPWIAHHADQLAASGLDVAALSRSACEAPESNALLARFVELAHGAWRRCSSLTAAHW